MASDVRVSAPTEERHPATTEIDTASTLEILTLMNDADRSVADAVAAVLPELAVLVDHAVEAIRAGGHVHYFGAGTSGRLAVLDAAELLPTFNVPEGLFVAHHAGGSDALLRAVENVEDDVDQGAAEAADLTSLDIAIGLTASGRTPFVQGALAAARDRGARTALVTANPGAELTAYADHVLAAETGPEILTGSTRLKAGTAQKLILNGFSTAVMIRLGRTWSNLMVDVVATNAKLRGRTIRILQEATGVDEGTARTTLDAAGGELKPALLSLLAGVPVLEARAALATHGDSVATALRGVAPDVAQ
ncbi:N-acetylmuramic acid 6-phosphate etherase [Knoellia subterranea]|uniref:N-acetylmuramic acid 6-phosphate etherase n=1 Tax=Knoellia subterranea KCTC 19937 TaxID=1385521 RepID=A0A0A0JLR2_9MICO|nr:N-acetylmuramic acid 6-phosphate etherase [Knoellia subterranea]KGN38038.1 N-acetylmuramic acid-6-phosphate etherase [Knoellia subterranea KCTC 19937]